MQRRVTLSQHLQNLVAPITYALWPISRGASLDDEITTELDMGSSYHANSDPLGYRALP